MTSFQHHDPEIQLKKGLIVDEPSEAPQHSVYYE